MVDWHTEQITKERAKERPSELRIASIQDKYQCIVAFCQGRNSVDDVVAAIRRVFQEDTGSGIVFSTIHKAKGLEAKRVFLLQPRGARMPHPMAKLEWEVQQEHNLAYVAITRAIEELVFVS
jgi:DNA helicase-2/ATP-dependent DNA helicase PcrA